MMGSTYIVIDILRLRTARLKSPYYRIILALSLFDLLSSFWFFIASWAKAPNDAFHKEGNPGNVATCNASGFFIQLGTTAIPLYNSTLSMHFFLSIRRRWSHAQIYTHFERYAHAIIPSLALVLAIIPLPLKLYNPWYFYCYISVHGWIDETQAFERGTLLAQNIFQIISLVIVFGSAIFGITVMGLIFFVYQTTTRKSRKHSFEHTSSTLSIASARENSTRPHNRARPRRRKHAVAIKALLYTIPFFLTWVIPALIFLRQQLYWRGVISTLAKPSIQYSSLVYVATAMPLQGFFNWFAYMLPHFQTLCQKEQSTCCFRKAAVVAKSDDGDGCVEEFKENDIEPLEIAAKKDSTRAVPFGETEVTVSGKSEVLSIPPLISLQQ